MGHQGHCHVETGQGQTQTGATKPLLSEISLYAVALRLTFIGMRWQETQKNSPSPINVS